MSKEKQYIKWFDNQGMKTLDLEIKKINCIMCGLEFSSPMGDLSLDYNLSRLVLSMGGLSGDLPVVVGKLCPACWKDIYLNSRDPNNTDHVEKLEEFKRLIRRETGASEEEYEASQEKKTELATDKTEEEWAKFQAEKNKKRKGDN